MDDIVAIAAGVGGFRTLLTAVEAAGLVDVLQEAGPITVFAPTDEAFAQLPKGSVEALLKEPETLRAILRFHVVPGRITSDELFRSGGARANTAHGEALTIAVTDGELRVAGARVLAADVQASNGVVHVVDTVLMPQKAMSAGPVN